MPGIEWSNGEQGGHGATGAAEASEPGQVRQTGASGSKDDPGPAGVSVEPADGVFGLINENDIPCAIDVLDVEGPPGNSVGDRECVKDGSEDPMQVSFFFTYLH